MGKLARNLLADLAMGAYLNLKELKTWGSGQLNTTEKAELEKSLMSLEQLTKLIKRK